MTQQEVVVAITTQLDRCGCRLIRHGDQLGVFPARRISPPQLNDLISAQREALLASTEDTGDTDPTDGGDQVWRVGPGRNTSHMEALRDLGSPELEAAVAQLQPKEE